MIPPARRPQAKTSPLRMPKEARWELQDRLRRHEKKWEVRDIYLFTMMRPSAAYVRIGFMDPAMDVEGEDCMELCRLEWTGSMERWRLAYPRLVGQGYDPAPAPLGSVGGTPEACVDAAIEDRLGWDPQSPTEDSGKRTRLEGLMARVMDFLDPGPPPSN